MKIDPYKHKERYLSWKSKNNGEIKGMTKANSDLTMKYLSDMEKGINIAQGSVKGPRSFIRLNSIRDKMRFFSQKIKELFNLDDLTKITEEQLIEFFGKMRTGELKKLDGKEYTSTDTFARAFKSFWHWHQKAMKKQGIEIKDITRDVDTSNEKPKWVYLTEDEIKKLSNNAKFEYRVLINFLFDTGIRVTELVNIKVSDFFNNFKELNIREEVSKTFGRRIKLMICSELIKEYIKTKALGSEDYLFNVAPTSLNKYLKRLSARILGDKVSPAGAKYSELTMYDFRHNSCCYWLPRYKSESALKYRFGWKKSDKIHYYSELFGMKDTISEEDMLLDVTKTEIEKRLEKSEKEKELMQDELKDLKQQLLRISELTERLFVKVSIN